MRLFRRRSPGRAITAALQDQLHQDELVAELHASRERIDAEFDEIYAEVTRRLRVALLSDLRARLGIPLGERPGPLIDDGDDVEAADARLRRELEAEEDARRSV